MQVILQQKTFRGIHFISGFNTQCHIFKKLIPNKKIREQRKNKTWNLKLEEIQISSMINEVNVYFHSIIIPTNALI